MPRPSRQPSTSRVAPRRPGVEQVPLAAPELLLVVRRPDDAGGVHDQRGDGPPAVGVPDGRADHHGGAAVPGGRPQRVEPRIVDLAVGAGGHVGAGRVGGEGRRVVRRQEQLRQHDDPGAGGPADQSGGGGGVAGDVAGDRLGLDGRHGQRVRGQGGGRRHRAIVTGSPEWAVPAKPDPKPYVRFASARGT